MTSATDSGHRKPTVEEHLSFAMAGRLVDGLAARDFDAVVATLADDVSFRALLPRRVLDVDGIDSVRAVLDTWFGRADRWEVVEAVVGEIAGRIHLRWRVRLTDPNLGPGPFLVEQQVYADASADGRLRDVALICTGYLPEKP
jgi:hypothetical protein